MPSCIVLVHNNPEFLAALECKLRHACHDVVAFTDPIAAFDVLSSSKRVEVLVTGVIFGPNQPHGIALANAGRARRPLLKVIFATDPAAATHVEDEGTVFLMPVHPDRIVQAVSTSLAAIAGLIPGAVDHDRCGPSSSSWRKGRPKDHDPRLAVLAAAKSWMLGLRPA